MKRIFLLSTLFFFSLISAPSSLAADILPSDTIIPSVSSAQVGISSDAITIFQAKEGGKETLQVFENLVFANETKSVYKEPLLLTLGNENIASPDAEYITPDTAYKLEFRQEKNGIQILPSKYSYLYPQNPKMIRLSYIVPGNEFIKRIEGTLPLENLYISFKPLSGYYPKPVNFDFAISQEKGWLDSQPIAIGSTSRDYSFKVIKGTPLAKYDVFAQSDMKVSPATGSVEIKEIPRLEHLKLYLSQKFTDVRFAFMFITIFWLAVILILLAVFLVIRKFIRKNK